MMQMQLTGPYQLTPGGTDFAPARPGVYLLAKGSNNAVFYVGQATDIKSRLKQHLASSEPNSCIKNTLALNRCSYYYVVIDSQTSRDLAERDYYNRYGPTCNTVRP